MDRASALRRPRGIERQAPAGDYSTKDVAALLGLSAEQIRGHVRAGFLSPRQGSRGEYSFSFQDLVLLRTAVGLLAARVPRRRVRLALQSLREQLPADQPLTGVRIAAHGHHVVVRDGSAVWEPESGQTHLDFERAELSREASSLPLHTPPLPEPDAATEWYERGCAVEDESPDEAVAAYHQALELRPEMADAHLNLGRLLHERGETDGAERHYRCAVTIRPDDALASYNLGVALQDLGRLHEAATAYETALAHDGTLADAHYNLAGIYEQLGEGEAAFRHLRTYKKLTRGR